MSTAIRLESIVKIYPGVKALDGVSFSVEKGHVHSLVGENGAGKSTLIKVISGAEIPNSGTIYVEEKPYSRMTPALSGELGIGVIYQEYNLVPSLSVLENVFLGYKVGGKIFPDLRMMRKQLNEVLEKLDIHLDPDVMVSTLSVAEQQFVEIAKSLVRNVRVLIMDEPSATLSNKDVDKLFDVITHLKEEGVTVIYISHRMEEIFRISDDVTVMRDGKHIFTGPISEVDTHSLITMMVGREISETYPERHSPIGEAVLEVEHLYGNGDRDISFVLHKGEILGLAGLVGAGRTELAKVLYGAVPKEKGIIRVKGKEVTFRNPEDAVACGIGLIPEDRKGEGAFLNYSILWNSVIMALKKDANGIFVDDKKMEEKAEELSKTFQIKAPSLEQLVRNLSGGNQQKTVLAKTFAADTDILIFDEPTRGIDIGVKHDIYKLMNEIAERGVSIIMISSEMEELIGMSDRILVLHEGDMMGEVPKERFDSRYILKLASGIKED